MRAVRVAPGARAGRVAGATPVLRGALPEPRAGDMPVARLGGGCFPVGGGIEGGSPCVVLTCETAAQPPTFPYMKAKTMGPNSTMKTVGKMHAMSGKSIFTGASLASFSARWVRSMRSCVD